MDIRSGVSALALQPRRPRTADVLWYGRSVRTQILIVFVALNVVAASVAAGVIVYKAGISTRIEIAASMRLAELMVSEAVQLIPRGVPAEPFLRRLPGELRYVRHVRLRLRDAAGQVVGENGAARRAPQDFLNEQDSLNEGAAGDDRPAAAPRWFARLIVPPVERHEVAVVADGRRLGSVEIVSEPRDEIAEVWSSSVALASVAGMTVLTIIAILYLVLDRVLDPLTALTTGLRGLEQRDYKIRLVRPKVLEFARLADRFNALAGALDAVNAENLALNRRLITAQDDERRRTALELHDEVGPSLFGLKANVASIAKTASALPGAAAATVTQRACDLTAIVDHLQGINRGMLNRLRPMALGHVPLCDIIAQLVNDRAREHPDIVFTHHIGRIRRSYDDIVDLTVYRCIQESLTNAIRHARAKTIMVTVAAGGPLRTTFAGPQVLPQPARDGARGDGKPGPGNKASAENNAALLIGADAAAPGAGGECLQLTVRDDGIGIADGQPPGFGLRGMQERVQALGGEFTIGFASEFARRRRDGELAVRKNSGVETSAAQTDLEASAAGSGGGTCVRIVIPLPGRAAPPGEPASVSA